MSKLGDLTYTTDGLEYTCWWSPTGEPFNGPRGVPLARIAVRMLHDKEDFKTWQKQVEEQYEKIVRIVTGEPDMTVQIDPLPLRSNAN